MGDERTVRHSGITGIPVQSVEATVIEGPDVGKQASARSEKLSVGSARDNDLQLTDETVSRYHLELWGAPEGVRVHDPGSTNGTWVGAVRVQSGVVPPGSILKLGKTTLRLGQGEPLTLALHKDEALAGLRRAVAADASADGAAAARRRPRRLGAAGRRDRHRQGAVRARAARPRAAARPSRSSRRLRRARRRR